MNSKINACVLGFAIGEAFGLPLNYIAKEKLINKPVTKMLKCENYDVPIGTWSSGTSNLLATMDSIITKTRIDYNSIADNLLLWYKTAKYTATASVLDIDFTSKHALNKYFEEKSDATKLGGTGYSDCGNEFLPRLLPIAFYLYCTKARDYTIHSVVKNVTFITHRSEIPAMAAYIFTKYIIFLLRGTDKLASFSMLKNLDYTMYFKPETIKEFEHLLKDNVYNLPLEMINSNNYVIDTLEAFFYCFINSNSFSQALIGSVNLGGQASMFGGLCSSVAAIYYGYETIPTNLVENLNKKEYLMKMVSDYEDILNII